MPIFGAKIDYQTCIKLLIGAKSISEAELKAISDNVSNITLYFSSSFLLAYVLGRLFQKFIFYFNPYKTSKYAFDTPWYYELTGKLSETQNAELIKLSCLVESKNTAFLYYGVLEDFYLSSDGQLNRIVLSRAMRRPIESDESQSDTATAARFYDIKGDRLILKYEDIKNINIEYLYIVEEE